MHDLVPITMFTGLFAMIFGIAYLRTRENMAMLEKGFNPRINQHPPSFMGLKIGLLMLGAGIGLFTAYILDTKVLMPHTDPEPIYFSMIGICGGVGLIISHIIEKKQLKKQSTPNV